MFGLEICAAVVLVLLALDVSSCLSFYFETNKPPDTDATIRAHRRLSPDQVTLRHAFLFLIQKANYYWQFFTSLVLVARLHLRPKRTRDLDVALLLVNTSLATWVKATPLGDKAITVSLDIAGFAAPFHRDRFDNHLVVETELRLVDQHKKTAGRSDDKSRGLVGERAPSAEDAPFEARTLRFEWNGEAIDSRDEQLSILAVMVSSVTHPVVHAFHNDVYAAHSDERLQPFNDFFLHGQYLNWCAWFWPGVLFRIAGPRGHHWYKRVLEWNAQLPLPKNHGPAMVPLAPYSRFARFVLASRPVLIRLCQEHAVPMSLEALFVCTILHAADHASCDAHTRGHLLQNHKLPDEGLYNFIALLFYRPAQHFWTNLLRDKQKKTPLYQALYGELRALDAWYADQVTLSISY